MSTKKSTLIDILIEQSGASSLDVDDTCYYVFNKAQIKSMACSIVAATSETALRIMGDDKEFSEKRELLRIAVGSIIVSFGRDDLFEKKEGE